MECLFEVRSGNVKSSLDTIDGQQRVTGFNMSGDLLGFDGVASGYHAITVTALEDTEVCTLSYARLTSMAQGNAELQHTLMQLMGWEIVRELHLAVLLASMSAEERIASFLLDLSRQMSTRGYSPNDFRMRMTRADIGSYLGLSLETVSRTFSALQRLDILDVDHRHIRITDLAGLASRR
jgi:CRP/FNR family transcriptional regulator